MSVLTTSALFLQKLFRFTGASKKVTGLYLFIASHWDGIDILKQVCDIKKALSNNTKAVANLCLMALNTVIYDRD